MDDFPKTSTEFRERFPTEESCVAYLVSVRWPDGFECPACRHRKMRHTGRGLFECGQCRRQTSATAGTLFHDTRKPLRLWFEAMWQIASQKYGANALGLQRVLNLGSYNTAWQWLHKLRRAMVRPGRDKLSGTVEVDETFVGGRRLGKRGRGSENKTLVAIAVEDRSMLSRTGKGIGRIRLRRIPDASAVSLEEFIRSNIENGSNIRTDGWNGYNFVSAAGFEHSVVGSRELVIAHLVASLPKRWLLGTYQGAVASKHLDYYLDEFTFRFNRRKSTSRGKLFYRLVQQSVLADPVRRREIIGGADSLRKKKTGGVDEPHEVSF